MKARSTVVLVVVFVLGVSVGVFAKGKKMDPNTYRGKSKKEAAQGLLGVAQTQAGKGSWENIAVGRVYYAGGIKSEGQAIFDRITSKKAEDSDLMRIGRAYYDAGDWEKAKETFEKVLAKAPKDAPWLIEIGAYYNLKGDRKTAEDMFDRAFAIESEEVWQTVNAAGSYVGVEPLR